ncbi:TetR/AcrR family transcriptional regulator [Persicobacter psychrovividus]|uniref:TetR family transcriptional regulator n=1 Tax=Persicobacter psychrovividus TaxID=387638 RepID=A0ABN6L8F1_9BACT|nr:TetR family transcriptional regulator [Persicobacter psychrovividus]
MRIKDEGKIARIYEATIQLVNEIGIVGATIPKIAKAAGMASGTLYIYFENKEALLRALYLDLKTKVMQVTFEEIDPQQPFKLQLFQLWKELIDFSVAHQPQRIFMEQYKQSPYYDSTVRAASGEWLLRADAFLAEGRRQLLIKDAPHDLVFNLMYGYLTALATAQHQKEIVLTSAKIEASFQLLWDAIKA